MKKMSQHQVRFSVSLEKAVWDLVHKDAIDMGVPVSRYVANCVVIGREGYLKRVAKQLNKRLKSAVK